MDAHAADDGFELIDLAGIRLPDLMRLDDSPFAQCLRRIIEENDNPEALTVVAFQSMAGSDDPVREPSRSRSDAAAGPASRPGTAARAACA